MKKLLTFLLLVISLLASGQSDSQSLEIEIKYWKSIAESNDTVAYREYLQRYGEDGLYKDEALTRIDLLKTSGKQAQSKSIDCYYYTKYRNCSNCVEYVVRFDAEQTSKVWLKPNNHHIVRSNLAFSRDFYENQTVSEQVKPKQYYGLVIYNDAWTKDEEYQYDPMKSTSARDVYFKRDTLYRITALNGSGSFYEYNNCLYKPDFSDHQYRINEYQGYGYVAFSKDKSSFIMWFEQDNNLDGVILEKREYKRVPKEELLPKAVNYDFLNE